MLGDVTIDQLESAERFSKKYASVVKATYQAELEALNSFYQDPRRMPSKINLSESENLAFDEHRIEYILRACNFLIEYYSPGKSILNVNLSDPNEIEFAENLNLMNARALLEHIAFSIFNISGSLRVKYKHLLTPPPFTWETFEHLGGVMKVAPPELGNIVIRNVYGFVAQRLCDEFLAVETTVEVAVPSIVRDDIPSIKLLFSFIQKSEVGLLKQGFEIKPIELIATKALTRRILDTESLIKLLKFASNVDSQEIERLAAPAMDGQLYYVELGDNTFQREMNLDTKQSRHAWLRRLEMIGELVTGKYTSAFIKDLDPSIDWEAFGIIRDVIAHQDEGGNRYHVQRLLDDRVLFGNIINKEFKEFFLRLGALVGLRDGQLPKFVKDPVSFWSNIYAYEKKQIENKKQIPKPVVIEKRASSEEIDLIRQTLQDNGASDEIVVQVVSILNGILPVPDRKIIGTFMSFFPSKDINKELRKQCKDVFDKALRPRTTLAQREGDRASVVEAAEQREKERQSKLLGLVGIRALAEKWKKTAENSFLLTPQRRLQLAIDALENIKELMETDIFVKANFGFKTMEEWGAAQSKLSIMNLFARLKSSPEFNDALEYNAAQLLQHLETIRTFPESQGRQFLDKENDYEVIRNLRNWIEHGNALHDREEYEPGKQQSILEGRQEIVAPIMITLIFKLLPSLYEIKKNYTWAQDFCISPENPFLWAGIKTTSKDDHPNNKPCGPGYGF